MTGSNIGSTQALVTVTLRAVVHPFQQHAGKGAQSLPLWRHTQPDSEESITLAL